MDNDKQVVLERLAGTSPLQLCNEAKIERCRAMRNLHRCGQEVHDVLLSCGHAGLCPVCIQIADVCPVCSAPVSGKELGSIKTQPRLYDECELVGLATTSPDEELVHPEGGRSSADVRRLFTFFDIALENGLVSLICHYVIEVCLDNTAVSSDAVKAVLLDGAVVKEWATNIFTKIKRILRDLYGLSPGEMCAQVERFNKLASQLRGVSQVVEALEAPIVDPYSAVLMELRNLLEAIRRVSQHLDVMAWCARHSFLEDLPGRFPGLNEWRAAFRVRKHYIEERTWPDSLRPLHETEQRSAPRACLFIEEAVENLGLAGEDEESGGSDALELVWLKRANMPPSPSFRSRWEDTEQHTGGNSGMEYPPESVRDAVDTLFLDGSSDLGMAKKAIFLYYLFDRYWGLPSSHWESLLDDYVVAMELPQHVKTESHVFFLLDEDTEIALKEVASLLPEIAGPAMHPRVPRVLLQRNQADLALSVLRASGRYGRLGPDSEDDADGLVSPEESVTAVRILMECGLLLDAFVYQRSHCRHVAAEEASGREWVAADDAAQGEGGRGGAVAGEKRMAAVEREMLVGEVCWLCIRRGWVDRMVGLPWNSSEEPAVAACLLEAAKLNPCSSCGSFLFIYYIQRNRFVEARALHQQLEGWEAAFASECIDDHKLDYLRQAIEQRRCLLEAGLSILPRAFCTEEPSQGTAPLLFSEAAPHEATLLAEFHEQAPAALPPPVPPVSASPILFPHLYTGNPTAVPTHTSTVRAAMHREQPRPTTRRDLPISSSNRDPVAGSKRSAVAKNPPPPVTYEHSPILGRRLSYEDVGGGVGGSSVLPSNPFSRQVPVGPDHAANTKDNVPPTLLKLSGASLRETAAPSPFPSRTGGKALPTGGKRRLQPEVNGHLFSPTDSRMTAAAASHFDDTGGGVGNAVAFTPHLGLRGGGGVGEPRASPAANGSRLTDGGPSRTHLDLEHHHGSRRAHQGAAVASAAAMKRVGGAAGGAVLFGRGVGGAALSGGEGEDDGGAVPNGDVQMDGYDWKSGRDRPPPPPPRQTSDSLVDTDTPFSSRPGHRQEPGDAELEARGDSGVKVGPEAGSWPTAHMRHQAANGGGASPWGGVNGDSGMKQARTELLGPRWREEEEEGKDGDVVMDAPLERRQQRSGEKRDRSRLITGNSRFYQSLGLG